MSHQAIAIQLNETSDTLNKLYGNKKSENGDSYLVNDLRETFIKCFSHLLRKHEHYDLFFERFSDDKTNEPYVNFSAKLNVYVGEFIVLSKFGIKYVTDIYKLMPYNPEENIYEFDIDFDQNDMIDFLSSKITQEYLFI